MHLFQWILCLHSATAVLAMPNPVAEPNALALPLAHSMVEEKSAKHKDKREDDHDQGAEGDPVSNTDISIKCPLSLFSKAGWCGGCSRLETCVGTLGFFVSSCLVGSVTIAGVAACAGSTGFAAGSWNNCMSSVLIDRSYPTDSLE
ncbi:hypothetical protein AC579_500 [Pseudocercospora musae]|uniref:Uncharacterized protein n=1 Tax=Pseudocercospora musae TaxID=113226 RepID=A0A139I667_9PEZI|nr:hypothetical protein AC579_500 [Pseudocercospora musae]